MRYLLHRLLQAALLLVGVSFLTFLFSTLAPGNYLDGMRLNPQISPSTIAALRSQYELDRPLPWRYARWVNSVAHGELGYSFAYNSPVAPLLWVRARNTLLLTLMATLIAWALALLLGIWSVETQGSLPDRALSLITATLLVVPELVLALGFLILAARSGLLPTGGMVSVGYDGFSRLEKLRDLTWHMAVPVAVLVLSALPILVRHIRASVAETLSAPFVRAAAARPAGAHSASSCDSAASTSGSATTRSPGSPRRSASTRVCIATTIGRGALWPGYARAPAGSRARSCWV